MMNRHLSNEGQNEKIGHAKRKAPMGGVDKRRKVKLFIYFLNKN
jgi:hypothetical protein